MNALKQARKIAEQELHLLFQKTGSKSSIDDGGAFKVLAKLMLVGNISQDQDGMFKGCLRWTERGGMHRLVTGHIRVTDNRSLRRAIVELAQQLAEMEQR